MGILSGGVDQNVQSFCQPCKVCQLFPLANHPSDANTRPLIQSYPTHSPRPRPHPSSQVSVAAPYHSPSPFPPSLQVSLAAPRSACAAVQWPQHWGELQAAQQRKEREVLDRERVSG